MKEEMLPNTGDYERVAQAFTLKAGIYDEFGKNHPNLQRMRGKVYEHALHFFPSGARLLEINAGTGADAAFLARSGYCVHATDLSPGMLASIQAKIDLLGLQRNLSAQLCSFTDLSGVKYKPYDGIISNFGGLNCIPDLSSVARQLPDLLVPGGRLIWVIMPPVCPWDLAQLLKGDSQTALRRLRPGGTLANVEGVQFPVHYFTPNQVMRALGKQFRLLNLEGLSIFAPPADRKDFAGRSPRFYQLLVRLDEAVSRLPVLRGWGDFFILTAEYRP